MINERTIRELVEKLQQVDELTILELLDITSEELPELLIDQVEERYDILLEYFDEGEDDV
jgi:hypothetical protein